AKRGAILLSKEPNPIFYHDDTITVLLLNYKGTELPCFISTGSYDKVSGHRWHAQKGRYTYYAATSTRNPDGTQGRVQMHKLLLSATLVDHKDRNGLNNL